MMSDEPFQIADPPGLTDADWAGINKLKKAYETGGQKGLDKAFEELSKDPIKYLWVMGAFFPNEICESIKDAMAEQGITEEDLREIIQQAESPAHEQ